MKRKLLIATSNPGKFKEMQEFFKTQPFEIVSLADVGITETPEEPFDIIELNAYTKAKFYGEKSGLLTLSDDTGLYIEALGGWPAAHTAKLAGNSEAIKKVILEKMQGLTNRIAYSEATLVLYDPLEKSSFISLGRVDGEILESPVGESKVGFGFDQIFYSTELKKAFSEISLEEKNKISHRGKALVKIEYYLKKQYGARDIVVPCALVIQNGKMLMILRNDPHRPEYHRHWEFPGGGVEFREQMIPNVIRETEEETGLIVEPVKLLQHIATESQEFPTFAYQVYLVPYVCKVVGGTVNPRDEEALDAQWFELDDVTKYPLVGENARLFEKLLPELREVIKENNL
jgi:XTP/dITP diphosphohydrolase